MNEHEKIPEISYPITFNPHKHHLGFLKKQIGKWKKLAWPEVEKEMRCIGNNLIDVYCGKLTVEEICRECRVFAQKENITSPENLAKWLHPLEFRKTNLSDNSLWVIKQGLDDERFLHIHPAKYSRFTVRVRATTLKTVAALKTLQPEMEATGLNLQSVNRIRTENLGLSPVKALEKGKGIARLWELFNLP